MDTWSVLNDEVVTCRACPRLVAWREQVAHDRRRAYREWEYWGKPVPGFGDARAQILAVGLAPGAHGSNRTGRMFTGDASGDFLYPALYRAGFANQPQASNVQDGLELHNLYITAVCRCVPPGNKPTSGEISNCMPFLQREIDLLFPDLKVIVALGRIAFDAVLRLFPSDDGRTRADFGHTAQIALGEGKPWLVASYHPSRQNTQTGRLTVSMFEKVWQLSAALASSSSV
jgi:uracil-DNA glycosylase family 4